MFDFLTLLLAAGGGFFGAAIGGLHAFIFTGFMGLVGMAIIWPAAVPKFLTYVAFGPVFGPHIAFAGGVAAAAYAARQSKDVGGKDIGIALVSHGPAGRAWSSARCSGCSATSCRPASPRSPASAH